MEDFSNETARYIEHQWNERREGVELDIGVLVAMASEWTEDEMELDDLVTGLVESGRVELALG